MFKQFFYFPIILNECSDLNAYACTFKAILFNYIPLLISLLCDLFKFVCLNICLGYKSHKNWWILTKFGYVFVVSNITLCTENYARILDTFYRVISKCWIAAFIYVPLSISLGDNTNVITRTYFITGFEQRPTGSKFGTEVLERIFEESSKIFFHKLIQIFFQIFF